MAALWLEAEPEAPTQALRRFVVAGPGGVWDLAGRHLPEALGAARLGLHQEHV
jgi:tripartite-type tricarboxylate transporter receptor subunit TctC